MEDRRSFTPQGKRRPGAGKEGRPRSSAPRPEDAKGTEIDDSPFLRLVGGLAAGAYMALGASGTRESGRSGIDLAAAREAIDLLTALQEKTAGNLESMEQEMLDRSLTDLRLLFVQRKQEGGGR